MSRSIQIFLPKMSFYCRRFRTPDVPPHGPYGAAHAPPDGHEAPGAHPLPLSGPPAHGRPRCSRGASRRLDAPRPTSTLVIPVRSPTHSENKGLTFYSVKGGEEGEGDGMSEGHSGRPWEERDGFPWIGAILQSVLLAVLFAD